MRRAHWVLSVLGCAACAIDDRAGVASGGPAKTTSENGTETEGGDSESADASSEDGCGETACDEGEAVCGDGQVDWPEECDGSELSGASCGSLGEGVGELACDDSCRIDASACKRCGDGVLDEDEECDGDNLGGASCQSLGFDHGDLACTSSCTFATDECLVAYCGDGTVDEDEECDGDNLGGETCESQGFAAGMLQCDECLLDLGLCETVLGCGLEGDPCHPLQNPCCDGPDLLKCTTPLQLPYGTCKLLEDK